MRLAVAAICSHIGTLSVSERGLETLTHCIVVLYLLVVQLLCIADKHLFTKNNLRFLLAERALIVVI